MHGIPRRLGQRVCGWAMIGIRWPPGADHFVPVRFYTLDRFVSNPYRRGMLANR